MCVCVCVCVCMCARARSVLATSVCLPALLSGLSMRAIDYLFFGVVCLMFSVLALINTRLCVVPSISFSLVHLNL